MITLFQIDKSGRDIFEKDYSIVLIVNKEEIYGVNISQKLKDDLNYQYKNNFLKIEADSDPKKKTRFRLRFHTAVIIKLLEKAIKDLGYLEDVNIQICNDFDGHFHEIKEMVFTNLTNLIPSLKREDIVSTKFQKPSQIDIIGKEFRENNTEKLKNYNKVNLNSKELIRLVKK